MKLHQLICGALAALTFTLAGGSALAAEAYRETALPLAKSTYAEFPYIRLFVTGEDQLDYFYQSRRNAKGETPEWYHSADGGKTWQEKDMSWHAAVTEQAKQNIIEENLRWAEEKVNFDISFEKAGTVESIYMSETGVPYFTVQTATRLQQFETTRTETPGKTYSEFGEFEIYKVKDGKAQKIPGIKLGEPRTQATPFHTYEIVRAEEGGKVSVACTVRPMGSNEGKMRLLQYDEKTGKMLSESPEISARDGHYLGSGNLAYGIGYDDNKNAKLMAYDVTTGETALSLRISEKEGYMDARLGVAPGGAVYVMCPGGLYRLAPGAKALTKLVDGAGTRMADKEAGFTYELACTDGGKAYMVIENGGLEGKLYCYSPK